MKNLGIHSKWSKDFSQNDHTFSPESLQYLVKKVNNFRPGKHTDPD